MLHLHNSLHFVHLCPGRRGRAILAQGCEIPRTKSLSLVVLTPTMPIPNLYLRPVKEEGSYELRGRIHETTTSRVVVITLCRFCLQHNNHNFFSIRFSSHSRHRVRWKRHNDLLSTTAAPSATCHHHPNAHRFLSLQLASADFPTLGPSLLTDSARGPPSLHIRCQEPTSACVQFQQQLSLTTKAVLLQRDLRQKPHNLRVTIPQSRF